MGIKRDKNGKFVKGTAPANPTGRPKDGESWASVIKAVGEMYPEDLLEFIPKNNDLGKVLVQLPKGVQMKYLVTARVFAALMFEPSAGLWNGLMDRAEGKVPLRAEFTGELTVENLEQVLSKVYGSEDQS